MTGLSQLWRTSVILALGALSLIEPVKSVSAERPTPDMTGDLVVVGATPAGITAAISAARAGLHVLVLERSGHIGGLPANGLGATDIATRGATGGLFLNFVGRVRRYYVETYGPDSPQVHDCSDGYCFEPHVAENIFEQTLAEHSSIRVLRHCEFESDPANVTLVGGAVAEIRIRDRASESVKRVGGRTFIDATYEGDLAAAAGVRFRVGREDRRDFDEPMAGALYKQWRGDIGAGTTGRADNAIQAYNFRLALTKVSANRVPIARPADYRREDYASLVDDVRRNRQTGPAGAPRPEMEWVGLGRIVNMKVLPNGKVDANNQHAGFLSTDLPEENWPWPTSSWEWRDRFAARLRDYTLGLIWFCQHDAALPAGFRTRCAEWGLASDEYVDNQSFPRQVYVREGRRIDGEYLFTAHDSLPTRPAGRPPLHRDSVTASHYSLDSHAVRKREPDRVHLDGFFAVPTQPYMVPYGVMVPRDVDGLLVPVAASSTHVGFSTIRMEPCWMALGEAAGTAAARAVADGRRLRAIDLDRLQVDLVRHGAVLIYFRDVPRTHPAFEAIQMLGVRGLLPDWNARPGDPIDEAQFAAWRDALDLPREPLPPTCGSRAAACQELWGEIARRRRIP